MFSPRKKMPMAVRVTNAINSSDKQGQMPFAGCRAAPVQHPVVSPQRQQNHGDWHQPVADPGGQTAEPVKQVWQISQYSSITTSAAVLTTPATR